MTDAKLRMTAFVLLGITINCCGGVKGSEKRSRMAKYAPKGAVAAIYLDVSGARKGLADTVKKHPKEAKQIKLDVVEPMLEKIDAVIVYFMKGRDEPLPVIVVHGEVRPGDLTVMLAKLIGPPEAPGAKLEPKGNGRYELAKTPFLIIDGKEADDLDGKVIVAGLAPMLTGAFVGALGKGQCKAVTLAIDKADTSAFLWGGVVFDKPPGPSAPKSAVFSANLTGDKLFRAEMTFASEEAATKTEMRTGVQFYVPTMAVKRSGATLTFKSTKSGSLIDLLIPAIGKAVEQANQASCRANLKGIAMGCAMYRAENKDRNPENLKVMVDMDLITPGAFKCRSDSLKRACSYLYVAPWPGADGRTLMLCDLKGNHEQIRNVAFKNGAAKTMTEAEFQAALKLPRNAAFAAALEKADG